MASFHKAPDLQKADRECVTCGALDGLSLSPQAEINGAVKKVRLLSCERCREVLYCSAKCKHRHWEQCHRAFCASPRYPTAAIERTRQVQRKAKRKQQPRLGQRHPERPLTPPTTTRNSVTGVCAICEEGLEPSATIRLPCGHDFHSECVWGLDRLGLSSPCPTCAERFHAGTPEALFDDAMRRLFRIQRGVDAGRLAWAELPTFERNEMGEIIRMLHGAGTDGIGRYGSAVAQYNLGAMYRDGVGVEPGQWETAVAWFRKAATKGLAAAQYALARALERDDPSVAAGRERHRRDADAAYWYRRAADQGHIRGTAALAHMLHEGRGLAKCYSESVRLFRRAAEGKSSSADRPWGRAAGTGFAEAQHGLAMMYLQGHGLHQSTSKAMMWLERAANQDFEPARRDLANVEKLLRSGQLSGRARIPRLAQYSTSKLRRAYYGRRTDLAGKSPPSS